MPLNLTQFEKNQASKKKYALGMATHFIEIMEKRTCCISCEVQVEEIHNVPEEPLRIICDLAGAMLFSSGYVSKCELKKKKKDGIPVRFTIMNMTDEDKIKFGLNNDDKEEDPTEDINHMFKNLMKK